MALKLGTQAPDFTLKSTSGQDFSLSKDQKGKPVVLYFYPKDFTRGCTQEACDFRDSHDAILNRGFDLYGISPDSIEVHHKFRVALKLPYHLLADVSGEVSKLYAAKMPLVGFTKRITYILDENHLIRAVTDNLFDASLHLKSVLSHLGSEPIYRG